VIAPVDALGALVTAVAERDLVTVRRLVLGPLALPRDVREEVLAVASLPAESFRVPVALWRFVYVQQQLLVESPPPANNDDPSQLPLAVI
jgi:hypothetical protein